MRRFGDRVGGVKIREDSRVGVVQDFRMTRDEVLALRDSLRSSLVGFGQPHGYGVGIVEAGGVRFPVVNSGGTHDLPGIVLASELGYRSGTCTLAMTTEQFRRAFAELLPVEACTAFTHPNLWAWRKLLDETSSGPFVVVFIGRSDDRASDAAQRAFLSQADNTA